MEDEEEPEGEDLNSEDVRIVYPIVYMLLLILIIENCLKCQLTLNSFFTLSDLWGWVGDAAFV